MYCDSDLYTCCVCGKESLLDYVTNECEHIYCESCYTPDFDSQTINESITSIGSSIGQSDVEQSNVDAGVTYDEIIKCIDGCIDNCVDNLYLKFEKFTSNIPSEKRNRFYKDTHIHLWNFSKKRPLISLQRKRMCRGCRIAYSKQMPLQCVACRTIRCFQCVLKIGNTKHRGYPPPFIGDLEIEADDDDVYQSNYYKFRTAFLYTIDLSRSEAHS